MYSFELLLPLEGIPTALQVVYVGHQDGDERLASAGLAELVERYNRRVPPARLLFVCPSGVESRLKQAFDDRRGEFDGRLASASHAVIAPYGKDGRLIADRVVHLKGDSGSWAIEDALLEDLALRAVSEILDDTNTILVAPHGYAFRKLSSREEDIFVRAGNMLRDPTSLPVFSYLLLRRLPSACSVVYLDSFTVLSFALGLQSLVDYFRRDHPDVPALAIENFHSYQVAPEFRIPNEASYLVLISASTSGGLAKRLVSEKQANPDRIVHLLGVGSDDSDFQSSCVFFKERDASVRKGYTTRRHDSVIEIGTEESLVAQGSPIPVRITRDHVNPKCASELYKPFYGKELRFRPLNPDRDYLPIFMSGDLGDSQGSSLLDWINGTLVHNLPASMRVILHAGDSASAQLASWVREALPRDIDVMAFSDVRGRLGASSAGGAAIIVAYQDPGLERLREANIALRRVDPVHRHYVVAYSFPESQRGFNRLKQDLLMGSTGPQYGWSEYMVLPVGAGAVHESLYESLLPSTAPFDDQAIESLLTDMDGSLVDALVERNRRSSISNYGLFLPRTDGKPLKLRHGSIFFPNAKGEVTSQVATYAMVAAAVQAAREGGSPLPRFDDNPFVRSVLDPSMFARYSDGVLQASLLRSTRQSELDYSASNDMSRQFAAICKSVLSCHRNDLGDAALEFVHAIATRKVAMRRPDHSEVDQLINSIPALRAFRELLVSERNVLP